jgi:hypothetical protein
LSEEAKLAHFCKYHFKKIDRDRESIVPTAELNKN